MVQAMAAATEHLMEEVTEGAMEELMEGATEEPMEEVMDIVIINMAGKLKTIIQIVF